MNRIPLGVDHVEENNDEDYNEDFDDEVPKAARMARYIEHRF